MLLKEYNSFSVLKNGVPKEVDDLLFRTLTYKKDIAAEKFSTLNRIKWNKKALKKEYESESPRKKKIAELKVKLEKDSKALKKLKAEEITHWYQDGVFPTGHLNIVKKALKSLKQPYKYKDCRKKPTQNKILKWNNKPFVPRYYQEEAIKACLTNERGVVESAVGTGKSLIAAYVIKELSTTNLFIVPSKGLLDQIYQDFKIWFGAKNVETITTAKVKKQSEFKPIRIVVINTLESLRQQGLLQKLIHDVNALYVDEIHHAASSSYLKLLPEINNVYYRFGFTGTFLRNDGAFLDMWGFLSNVIYQYSAEQAIKDGFLTPVQIYAYELDGIRKNRWHSEYTKNYCGNPEMMRKIREIIYDYPDSQILILVNQKDKSGAIIHEFLQAELIECAYISGDDKKEKITKTIKDFNDKKINILIGSKVIGEGIDVRSTDHLIMCQGGKSEIVIVQAGGRAVRLYEGKKIATIHDFWHKGTKYLVEHAKLRSDIYLRNFGQKPTLIGV